MERVDYGNLVRKIEACTEMDEGLLLNFEKSIEHVGNRFQDVVIPAKAGIQASSRLSWTPACAGVTS